MNDTNSSENFTEIEEIANLNGIGILDLVWQISLIFLTSIPNAILLYILMFKIKEWTYSNVCFVFLTLSDFIVGALCLPLVILWLNVPNLNPYFGIFLVVVVYAQPQIGLYIILVLSWHRLKQLVCPLRSTEELSKSRIILLTGIWIVTYAIWIVILGLFLKLGYYDYAISDINPPNYFIIILDTIFYIMPLVVDCTLITVTIYCLILRAKNHSTGASRNSKTILSLALYIRPTQIAETSQATSSQNTINPRLQKASRVRLSKDYKAIACLITLAVNYLLTQVLYDVLWPLYKYNVFQDYVAYSASIWLCYATSMFNPFIVFLFHEKIQKAFKKLIKNNSSVQRFSSQKK